MNMIAYLLFRFDFFDKRNASMKGVEKKTAARARSANGV
jgi:hypothetical protein